MARKLAEEGPTEYFEQALNEVLYTVPLSGVLLRLTLVTLHITTACWDRHGSGEPERPGNLHRPLFPRITTVDRVRGCLDRLLGNYYLDRFIGKL